MLSGVKWRSLRCAAFGSAAIAASGCASAVFVETDFPTPVIETLPLAVGLFFEPELRDFIHAEALPRDQIWTIELGDANLAMLGQQYETMFATTLEIMSLPPSAAESASIDAVLSSTLERFEFDVPRASRDEFVEVWLQYRLQLLDAGGSLLIDWPVTGYGKAEIAGDRKIAVRRAAIVAMRDAGARISTEFTEQPAVQSWLQAKFNDG